MSEQHYVHNLTMKMETLMRSLIKGNGQRPRKFTSRSSSNTSTCGPAVILLQRQGGRLQSIGGGELPRSGSRGPLHSRSYL